MDGNSKLKIIAIDPGTTTGVAENIEPGFQNGNVAYGTVTTWDLSPATKTKTREAQPRYAREGKMWDKLQALFSDCNVGCSPRLTILVVESASAFMRGKAAVEVSHSLRGVIRAACWNAGVQYIEVQPADLKKWATGKGNASKEEMVQRANNLGYEGKLDDEADAYLLLKWAEENAPKFIKQ